MSGRSSNFTNAQESSLQRVEKLLKSEKVEFTSKERIKLNKALAVFHKVAAERPFIRAMNMLELYENAAKGIKLQGELEAVEAILGIVEKERDKLIKECVSLKIELDKYTGRSFWQRIKGVFNA